MSASDPGPGAPGAIARTLGRLAERIGVPAIDRLWVFPPLRRGRKEWGLVVIGEFADPEATRDDTRRHLHIARYAAEITGRGMEYEMELTTEGTLPTDRFSRVLAGVARRAEEDLGEPRAVEIDGRSDRFEALLEEFVTPMEEVPQS